MRRCGDTVKIAGDYQYQALNKGNAVQRFWHYNKQLTISELLPPASSDYVMDVGCGSGVVSAFLSGRAADVIGMDGNEDAINFAKKTFVSPNLHFVVGLVDEAYVVPRPLDKIYNLEVIEHIHADQGLKMLKNFHRLLKPGGKVFLSTPNYRSMWPLIEYCMDKLNLAPKLLEDQHVEFYHAQKLIKLCREAGFEVEVCRTSCFLAPWIAPVSWSAALAMDSLERKIPLHLGSILNCVLVRR